MKTIAVFLTDGFEMIEALTPVDYLRRASCNVITVRIPSPEMKADNIVISSHKVPMVTDMTFSEFMEKYENNLPDALVCPGGSRGAVNLSNCSELLSYLEKCNEAGKLIAAICASPAVVLGKTDILKGKCWTCYPGMKEEAGKEILENSSHKDVSCVLDKNLLTACGAGVSFDFAISLVELMAGKEEAERLIKATCL
ncbi:MAG: DJ-1/PfpI family protein [Treponemataceae bacterium]|nr:DJ-1/PfpI family protein [Treponemataceae bacterium]